MNITNTQITMLPLSQLAENKGQIVGVNANPRILRDDKYKALLKSLRQDDLTGVMPLKVYGYAGEWVVLGGNMRLKALREIGATKDVPCIIIPEDTPVETLRKIVIVDNSTFGEWDWDMLANEWDADELKDWGVDVPIGAGGQLDEKGNYSAEMTEYEQQQILDVSDEYIIVKCKAEEFDDMRAHFGLGFIRPLEKGKNYQDKREKARVVNWSDYVNRNTK